MAEGNIKDYLLGGQVPAWQQNLQAYPNDANNVIPVEYMTPGPAPPWGSKTDLVWFPGRNGQAPTAYGGDAKLFPAATGDTTPMSAWDAMQLADHPVSSDLLAQLTGAADPFDPTIVGHQISSQNGMTQRIENSGAWLKNRRPVLMSAPELGGAMEFITAPEPRATKRNWLRDAVDRVFGG